MSYDFRPAADGGWIALAAGPRLLVVPALDDPRAAWSALRRDGGFQAALDVLTANGLGATPPFVLLEWAAGSDARLIVRGDVAVTVTDAAGSTELSAAGVSTWVERAMPGLVSFAIEVAAADGPVLPLVDGAAMVAQISAGEAAEVVTPASGAAAPPATAASGPAVAAPPATEIVPPAAVPSTPEIVAPAMETPAAPVDVEATQIVPDLDDPQRPEPGEGDSYDYLFGDTMYRSVADAAVREEEPGDGAADEAQDADAASGDHDGQTVMTSDIAKLRAGRKRGASAAPAPSATQFALLLSSGAREPLGQPILVGRSPSVSKVSGGQMPRLLTIGGGDQDISRNHVQFSVEGGTVVVTDLHSKNGTTIALPGKTPQKLRAGEPATVITGTVVDLGGDVTFTVVED